jgi:hypothetical protein
MLLIKKLFGKISDEKQEQRRVEQYRNLIRREAKIGGSLFGEVPAGTRREFFCLDERTWVWHEEWIDKESGQRKVRTTRYDVRPNGILKVQDGQYRPVGLDEAKHLLEAAKAYQVAVKDEMYRVYA